MVLLLYECKQPCPGLEFESPCPFPTMVTIMPQAPVCKQLLLPILNTNNHQIIANLS